LTALTPTRSLQQVSVQGSSSKVVDFGLETSRAHFFLGLSKKREVTCPDDGPVLTE
jgi:hypothetical protein